MADDDDHHFETAESGASATYPQQAGSAVLEDGRVDRDFGMERAAHLAQK